MSKFYAVFEANWPEDEACAALEYAIEDFTDAGKRQAYLAEQADWIFRGQDDADELKRRFLARIAKGL